MKIQIEISVALLPGRDWHGYRQRADLFPRTSSPRHPVEQSLGLAPNPAAFISVGSESELRGLASEFVSLVELQNKLGERCTSWLIF